jgi:hypothetical protein
VDVGDAAWLHFDGGRGDDRESLGKRYVCNGEMRKKEGNRTRPDDRREDEGTNKGKEGEVRVGGSSDGDGERSTTGE